MRLSLIPYQLKFKYPFKIAHGVRSHTDVVYVKLEHEGFTSWGEASLPPYLPETQGSVIEFINVFAKSLQSDSIDDWFEKLSADTSSNMAAKAALDMALWDLKAQLQNTTIQQLLGIQPKQFPPGAYTIGICSLDEMRQRFEEATALGFTLFKLKLDGRHDEDVVRNFRILTGDRFAVDVNQGWDNTDDAVEKIAWLAEEQCFLLEQPLPRDRDAEMHILKRKCPVLLFADESCQTIDDLERLRSGFDGINVKLMKCGGISRAIPLIKKARELDFRILIGCMSESSVGCTAAAQLAPLADYADLDGPYLTANDPFDGMKVENGKIALHPLKQKLQLN